ESGNYRVEGVHPDYQFLENQKMAAGRFLNPGDLNSFSKVAIIGEKAKNELFGKADALHELIEIAGINFQVIGVFSDPGGDRDEQRVFIPITTAQLVFSAGNDIRSMEFTLPKEEDFDLALATSDEFTKRIEEQLK